MVIDELLVALGYDYDDKEVKAFKKELGETVNVIGKLVKVAAAGAAALTGLTVSSTRASDEQGKLALEIGDNVERIDALQFASRRAGGSAEGLASSLQQLAIRAAEAARGTGSGVEALGILGLSATDTEGRLKPASDLFIEISSALEGLDRSKQIELADKLGVRDSIRLLQQGEGGIKALIAEAQALGVTTQEDATIAAEFQDGLTDLWQILKEVGRTITREVAPVLSDLVEMFTDWWKTNKEIIKQKFPMFIDRLVVGFKLLGLAVGSFLSIRILRSMGSMVKLMRSLSIWTLITSAAVAILPLIIGAIVLLAKDANEFFNGDANTFFGGLLEKYPELKTEIEALATVMQTVYDITMMILKGWKEIIDLITGASFKGLKKALNPFDKESIWHFLDEVTGVNTLERKISGTFKGASLNPFANKSVWGVLDEVTGLNALEKKLRGTFSPQSLNPSGASQSVAGRVQHVKVDGMTFYIRSSNPDQVAREINKTLQQTAEELNTPVDQ